MNENLYIDEFTISLLHFNDPLNPIKDECGKLTWKSNYFDLSDKALIKPNGRFGNCIDLSHKSIFTAPPPEICDNKPRTIDFWFYMKDNSYKLFFCMGPDAVTGQDFGVYQPNDGYMAIIHYYDNPGVNIPSIELNIWHHLALVYDGTYEYLFLDGKLILKNQRNVYTPGGYLAINTQGEDCDTDGEILYDEFRISSIARWTENFIPPTYPYNKTKKIFLDNQNFIYGINNNLKE